MADIDALFLRGTVRLTAGRIEWCARSIVKKLRSDEAAPLGKIARETEAAGQRAYELFVSREKAKTALFSEDAKARDLELDDVVSGVFNQLGLLARIHAPGEEMGDRVRRLSAAFFPVDLATATNASYPDELAGARRMVALGEGALAADVAKVEGLGSLLALVEARAEALEAALDREKPKGPSYAEAQAAAAEAERRMVDLVMAVQVLYQGDGAEAAKRRTELLEPYVVQQASMRMRYRRRLPVVDVDPETGEEHGGEAAAPAEPEAEPA
jgi:hypothetical protein